MPVLLSLLIIFVVAGNAPLSVTPGQTISGDVSWYDPPSSYQVSWATIIGRFEAWGRLHGVPYDPAHPYCAMRDFPPGSFVEIEWGGKTAQCYIVDYGPDAAAFPQRVIDASVEVFERLAPRERGVLHGATVRLLNMEHCGPAPASPGTVARRARGGGRSSPLCLPYWY